MSNITKLLNIIDSREYTPYKEIEDLVRQIDENWRPETAYCQLRKQKPDRRDYKYPKRPSSDNPVVGYKPFRGVKQPRSEPLSPKADYDLNSRLISLLGQGKPYSVNVSREINNAIRSKELFIKRNTLEKYE